MIYLFFFFCIHHLIEHHTVTVGVLDMSRATQVGQELFVWSDERSEDGLRIIRSFIDRDASLYANISDIEFDTLRHAIVFWQNKKILRALPILDGYKFCYDRDTNTLWFVDLCGSNIKVFPPDAKLTTQSIISDITETVGMKQPNHTNKLAINELTICAPTYDVSSVSLFLNRHTKSRFVHWCVLSKYDEIIIICRPDGQHTRIRIGETLYYKSETAEIGVRGLDGKMEVLHKN